MIEENVIKNAVITQLSHLDKTEWIKTIDDLVKEVIAEETNLETIDGQLTRVLTVGYCYITNGNNKLMETSQTWPSGRVIYRKQSVAGKLRYTVNFDAEMLREISEELGIDIEILKLQDIQCIHTDDQYDDSPFYSGLPSIWHNRYYLWDMPDGLVKDRYIEDDGNKITVFEWAPMV